MNSLTRRMNAVNRQNALFVPFFHIRPGAAYGFCCAPPLLACWIRSGAAWRPLPYPSIRLFTQETPCFLLRRPGQNAVACPGHCISTRKSHPRPLAKMALLNSVIRKGRRPGPAPTGSCFALPRFLQDGLPSLPFGSAPTSIRRTRNSPGWGRSQKHGSPPR